MDIDDKPLVYETILSEKDLLLTKIDTILRGYELKESDIPLYHEYWNLLRKYRMMVDNEAWRSYVKEEDPLKKKLGLT